jgi:hypothetical protein
MDNPVISPSFLKGATGRIGDLSQEIDRHTRCPEEKRRSVAYGVEP